MYIEIHDLAFKYKNSTEVIKDFSLKIQKGEIVAILGESGSGKSTLLRLISGLETPSNGEINIDNRIIVSSATFIEPEDRHIGMVFQDYALFPHMTVEKNVMYGLKNMSKQEKKERMLEVLILVKLHQLKGRYPHELSGGQQQRIALARAIAPTPSLLLLDEPFSNLDANLKIEIRNELREILKASSTTTIFVTHDIEDAKVLADRIVYLNKAGE